MSPELARRLVDSQFPQWRDQPLRRLEPAGSDHVIYRLGASLSVRLPRHPGAIGQASKEAAWLPRLAPHLPLAVPAPVGVGRPDFGYPWAWAVSRWLPGTVATVAELGASVPAALALAGFLSALQRAAFRTALGLDDAAWARGRGWALTGGLLAYRAYAASDERVAAQTTRQITAALADAARGPAPARGRPTSPR